MEAIVLAGGFGTRLQKVISDLPKPMAPVAGRPFLEIILTSLAGKGFSRVVLSLGYMADKIVSYFGDSHAGMELVYEIEDAPLGTGGAVAQALTHCRLDHVYVFNGDTFLDLEIAELEEHWQNNQVPVIVAREVQNASRYGRLQTGKGRILGFTEKGIGGPGLINAGCYVLPTCILNDFLAGQSFSLEVDFLSEAVIRERFDVFVTRGHFIDIGVPEDYMRAQNELIPYIT